MSRPPDLKFEFVARYELSVLDRIDRSAALRAFSFPGAVPLDPQRELSGGVILQIRPNDREAWIGVFEGGGYGSPPAAPRQVLAWPDERSFCVVHAGTGFLVRADNPGSTNEIECWPIKDVLTVPELDLVVFADLVSLTAYGQRGVAWRTGRLAWDDLKIEGAAVRTLELSAYDPTDGRDGRVDFSVDLCTGTSSDKPYPDRID